jgi:6-phosphogluconolactonase
MSKGTKVIVIFFGFVLLAAHNPATFGAGSPGQNLHAGAVYVLTNQVKNGVAVFNRSTQGTLTSAGTFATGGAGNPVAQPGDPPTDALASQGSLILSANNQFLFAVNAGSSQISVLKINRNELTLVDLVDSGGTRPISLTLHDDLLYVLNEGGTPNITGFRIADDGMLTPLAASTRPLVGGTAADPAEVSFNSDGSLLVVTEKMGNRLDTYLVDGEGLPSAPMGNPSNGMTPFGFAFHNGGTLIVSEAFGAAPMQAAVSSYGAAETGALSVISGSVPNSQTASCWVVATGNGKFALISNTGSGTISSYRVDGDEGTLAVAHPVAATTGAGSAPIDMALNNNSSFLYVVASGSHAVVSFRVNKDGTLTLIDTDGGLPPGAQGIAAK